MTLVQVVNRVLRRLREDTVAALSTSSYARLIGEFVSEVHQEVALIHDWGNGYKDVVFDCAVGQSVYDLTADVDGGGDVISGGSVTNENSEPQARFAGYVYNTSSSTEPRSRLPLAATDYFNAKKNEDRDAQNTPCYVDLRLKADGTGYEAELYPIPNSTYRIRLPMWIPENELVTDGTDDNTAIRLPTRPIVLGAFYLALNERGEEMGEPGNIAERRYYDAIAAAIEADTKARQLTNRYDWYRD